jgi:hypothetical protein
MKKITGVLLILVVSLVFTGAVLASDNSVKVVSDTGIMVYGPLLEYAGVSSPDWGSPKPALETWIHPSWPSFPDPNAKWISTSYLIGDPDDGGPVNISSWRKFSKTLDLCEGAYNITGSVTANSDNVEEFYVNGQLVYHEGTVQDTPEDNWEWQTVLSTAFQADPADEVALEFIVRNFPGRDDPFQNPTALIFSADVNYDCPLYVEIDIKPGSFPSCFRNDGNGVIPVAIFGSEELDVTEINPRSVKLDGLKVVSKNKSARLMVAYEDINDDGYLDMVVKVEDVEGTYSPGMGVGTLEGVLGNGRHILGVGDICVRK